jgi:HK97 family phage prohead protease
MLTKNLTVTQMGETGKGLAILARLSEIDHDGDTYAKGAFSWKEGGEQWCPLIHHHDRYQMPFGKARVYEDGDVAYAELHLNLETRAGADWHKALLFDLAKGRPVQEYSYGFAVLDADYNIQADQRTRVLKRLDVHEVSTVVRGAGRGTGTLSMKALKEAGFSPLIASLSELAEALGGDASSLSATGRKQLEQIHAALGKALTPPAASPAEGQGACASGAEADAKFHAMIANERARHETREARIRLGL